MPSVLVSHCPKCGEADAVVESDADLPEEDSDACSNCGYEGQFHVWEMEREEAIEAGWLEGDEAAEESDDDEFSEEADLDFDDDWEGY